MTFKCVKVLRVGIVSCLLVIAAGAARAQWERLADPPRALKFYPELIWFVYPLPDTKLAADNERSIYMLSQEPRLYSTVSKFYRYDVVDNIYEIMPPPVANHYSVEDRPDYLWEYFLVDYFHAAFVNNQIIASIASDGCQDRQRCIGIFDRLLGTWSYRPDLPGRWSAMTADHHRRLVYLFSEYRVTYQWMPPGGELESVWSFDPHSVDSLAGPALSVVDNAVYLAGGTDIDTYSYKWRSYWSGSSTGTLRVYNTVEQVFHHGPAATTAFSSSGGGWGADGLHVLGAAIGLDFEYMGYAPFPIFFGEMWMIAPTHQIYSPLSGSWAIDEALPEGCYPLDGDTQSGFLYALFRCWESEDAAPEMRFYRLDIGEWVSPMSMNVPTTTTTTTTTRPPDQGDEGGDNSTWDPDIDEHSPFDDHNEDGIACGC